MSDRYLARLERALRERGVPARLRARFLGEARDHFLDAEAQRRRVRFGDPQALAQQLVDELGAAQARRLAVAAPLALAPAAAVYAALFLLAGVAGGWPDIFSGRTPALALPSALALWLAPQISLAAGALALLRALRRRNETVIPHVEVRLVLRRCAVSLAFGALTLVALALYGYEYAAGLAWWWRDAALAAPAALLPILAAAAAVLRAARLRVAAPGSAGDVFADVPELAALEEPWRLCVLFAAGLALATFAAGALAGAADEGVRNAAAETVAILGSYAAFGRFLGIRLS